MNFFSKPMKSLVISSMIISRERYVIVENSEKNQHINKWFFIIVYKEDYRLFKRKNIATLKVECTFYNVSWGMAT